MMNLQKKDWLVLGLLVLSASLYRVLPNRPLGFAPQIAMALFAGSVVANRKLSFLFPILSMLVSDLIFQLLYLKGYVSYGGFYSGQLFNYTLIALVTVIGFYVNAQKLKQIVGGVLASVLGYFLVSNLGAFIWGLDINNVPYPKNWGGLVYCYTAALPFLKGSLAATGVFSAVFFGAYNFYMVRNRKAHTVKLSQAGV